MKKYLIIFLACFSVNPCVSYAHGEEKILKLAVASNFRTAADEIANIFTTQTGNEVIISSASTGKLYAQIINGAPYDIFLAADEFTPKQLEEKQLTVDSSRFTYACGRLVLWGKDKKLPINSEQFIKWHAEYRKIAIANPKLAPYGAAALEVLKNLDIYERVVNRLVYGENINQTFQYVVSNSAGIGFVSLSQIKNYNKIHFGDYWMVPEHLHKPIRQQGVLLLRAKDSGVAYNFLNFMKSRFVKEILKKNYGYSLVKNDESVI